MVSPQIRLSREVDSLWRTSTQSMFAIIPFFKSWPNQLNRNEIKLYQCKEHGHYWLQPQDISPACPYTLDKSLNCSDIEEVINKK